MLEMDYKEDWL